MCSKIAFLFLTSIFLAFSFTGHADATDLRYTISGVLDEGGIFEGAFTIDTDAVDMEANTGLGLFEIFDEGIFLNETNLFSDGSISGLSMSTLLFQRDSPTRQQVLVIEFESDSLTSNVFAELTFEGFLGDVNQAQPLDIDQFQSGFFDGNGGGNVTQLQLQLDAVPEPSGLLLLTCFTIGALVARKRIA